MSEPSLEPLPGDRDELIERLRRARFRRTRLAPGYDARAVDVLLAAVADSLRDPPLALPMSGAKIRRTVLREVRILPGYDIAQVDAFIAALGVAVDSLSARET